MTHALPRYMIPIIGVCLCVLPAVAGFAQDDTPAAMALEDAMRLALQRHPSMAAAASDVDAAQAALEAQQARRLPTLSLDASGRIQQSLRQRIALDDGTIRTTGGTSETSDVTVGLTHTFLESGRSESIEAARVQAAASLATVENSRRQLLTDVAATFNAILAQQELVEVADAAVRTSQQHLELVDARIEAGVAAPSDRVAVEAELADAEFEAVRAVNAVWTALADLRALLAMPIDSLPIIRGDLEVPAELGELEAWIADAFVLRPDLEVQRYSLRVAELAVDQAEIDAGLTYSVQGGADYGRHDGTTGDTWFIGAGVSYPLFDRQSDASVERAEAQLEAVRQRLAEAELDISRQVTIAYYSFADANARVTAAEASVRAAERNLEVARERYAEGLANIIEVTDAELVWRRASSNLVQARYDRNISWYQLLAAAGRPLLSEAALDAASGEEMQTETVVNP